MAFLGPVGKHVRQQSGQNPVTREAAPGGILLPHYRTFGSIFNLSSRTYSYRWDEAVRQSKANAKAMLRDAYLRSLIQERTVPLRRWKWDIESADGPSKSNPKDPESVERERVRQSLKAIVGRTWKLNKLRRYLGLALWYGRYGSQLAWVKRAGKWIVGRHVPVNGDKIQSSWDGYPLVAINPTAASQFGRDTVYYDGGSPLLKLERSEYRQRFVIHTHEVEDADFWDGDMAGRVDGIGLRDFVYWAWWLREEMLSWLTDFMEKVGSLGVMLFYYEEGNAKAEADAQRSAAQVTNRNALAVPYPKSKDPSTAKVELLPANMTGVQFLKDVIGAYFEPHIERLFVGQSLSSGTEGSGLGGSGVADLHRDTKHNLLASDAEDQAETLTEDLVRIALELNYPGCPYEFRFVNKVPDPAAKDRLEAITKVANVFKMRFKADELREITGTTDPGPDDETVGGQEQSPDGGPSPVGPNPQPTPAGQPAPTPPQPQPGNPPASEPAAKPVEGAAQPHPAGDQQPVQGMAELVAAMIRAADEGDHASVDELARIGADPDELAGLLGDLGGEVVNYQWTAAQTKSGGTKAVWSGEGTRRPLYGKRAEAALAQKDRPKDEPGVPRGAAAMAAAGKQGWEKIRAENRPVIQQAIAYPGSVRPDQLPELADRLKAMTRDELRQMARDLQQQTGGKVKQEIVEGLLAHVRTGVEQAKPPIAPTGRKAKPAKAKSLASLVKQFGGLDPSSFELAKQYGGMKQAIEDGIPLGIFRKGGRGLDQLAEEMEVSGYLSVPENRHKGEYLLEQLKNRADSVLQAATADYTEAEQAHYREMEEAANAGYTTDRSDLAESVRIGEAAADREIADGAGPEGSPDRDSDALGVQGTSDGGFDDSFDFGNNADSGIAPPEPEDRGGNPLYGPNRQLDIFGNSHGIPRPAKPTWQPSLIPPEVERKADVEAAEQAFEAIRKASNPNDPSPLDFSTDAMDPSKTTPAAGLRPGGATREDRQEYLNKRDAAKATTTRSPVASPSAEEVEKRMADIADENEAHEAMRRRDNADRDTDAVGSARDHAARMGQWAIDKPNSEVAQRKAAEAAERVDRLTAPPDRPARAKSVPNTPKRPVPSAPKTASRTPTVEPHRINSLTPDERKLLAQFATKKSDVKRLRDAGIEGITLDTGIMLMQSVFNKLGIVSGRHDRSVVKQYAMMVRPRQAKPMVVEPQPASE